MESDGPQWSVILFFVLAVPVWIGIHLAVRRALIRRRKQKFCDFLEPMAASQRGRVIQGKPQDPPSMSFPHRNGEISVSFSADTRSKSGRPWTHVHAALSLPRNVSLSVFQDGIAYKAFKLVGGQDIAVGSEEFDRTFVVRGNDDASARAVLGQEIQERLLEVAGREVSLSLSQQKLELVICDKPASEDELAWLLKLFTLLREAVEQEVH